MRSASTRRFNRELIAFDVLRLHAQDLTGRPLAERLIALEQLFREHALAAPWSLCPTTTDPEQAAAWLADFPAVGIEGLVFKPLAGRYVPGGRGWSKYKARQTTEAIVGAVTGSLRAPATALLGRYDASGRFRYTGRTTTLPTAVRRSLSDQLRAADAGHPWTGRTFSAGWGSREHLSVLLVVPEMVAEVAVDVAKDAAGRWRHPTRLTRIRTDMGPDDVPPFGAAA
ncbi:ATP-dependent DNA ligase [Streptomyces sp. NPDC057280]|uniref:ATP-dependent DNA ligase n=1 Tax=Streptomyces sp. NPDC057280 TaxID=3346081 RepID=UPI00362570DC